MGIIMFCGHDLMSQFAGNKEDIVGIGLDPSVAAVRY